MGSERLGVAAVVLFLSASACARAPSTRDAGSDAGGSLDRDDASTRDDGAARPHTVVIDPSEKSWFLSTWGSSSDDRYAAGGTPEEGRIYHFDGKSWTRETLPTDTPLVNWVFGFGPSDVFAVTNAGGVLHFDGDAWTADDTPTNEDLWGVWGAARDDLWAVGGSGSRQAQATLLHYDGENWSEVPTEIDRPGVHAYFKVWGTSARNVYVVGQNGVMQHFNGTSWTELNVGASDDLIALWGTGPKNIVAVGGRSSAIVSRFDGDEWTTKTLFATPGANGIWMRNNRTAHLALTKGYLARLDLESLEVALDPSDEFLDFHAVFGTSDGVLTAVGLNAEASLTHSYEGLVVERDLEASE